MYICLCRAVTDRDIRRAVDEGARSFAQLQERTGCSTCCGCCSADARACLDEALEQTAAPAFPAVLWASA
ncbi:(2Fe-2S)-binding protein [Aerosticca soli]|uniref:Bacterioferritin-associated ferredoxin n=1 Tax=Aerosticca soli TaxID=2010829 RepID=A0A2Z6E2U8_9GAMM|nr:(2Fe-2S)-binding protein [Aerosticca soli]MDI3262587.1 (2Fe-2S)-binding protein [Fulvimonas sp.]BBD78858.1 BFD-like (2Fe-2S)-binding protein [Aerosticca soli]